MLQFSHPAHGESSFHGLLSHHVACENVRTFSFKLKKEKFAEGSVIHDYHLQSNRLLQKGDTRLTSA